MSSPAAAASPVLSAPVNVPRIKITFCTQCKWMLRAAYELLSTFGDSLGEVALIPATGGVFTVELVHAPLSFVDHELNITQLWDRKARGGFPEVKHLKQLVRDIISPGRDLGHVDRKHRHPSPKPVPLNNLLESEHQGNLEGKDVSSQENCVDCA